MTAISLLASKAIPDAKFNPVAGPLIARIGATLPFASGAKTLTLLPDPPEAFATYILPPASSAIAIGLLSPVVPTLRSGTTLPYAAWPKTLTLLLL
ncbi:MAG: hypothetical protein NVSMB64_07210 [Candidatus Velthaea sp.]